MPNTSAETQMGMAGVHVEGVVKRFGLAVVLRGVDLTAEPGTIVALLGPSGCGKTTLLRSIAGLETVDAGEVRVGGRVLTGSHANVPPERRRVGMVFQDWALFPHLTVARNVGYGVGRTERAERVEAALEMVGLAGLGDRLPSTLSGGQQQRVALARALAPRPSVLLLDEPFSNLDTTLRVQVRTEVHRLLREVGITTIFVTHDQEEAFVLGDTVAVMQAGKVVQQALPSELYAAPATRWVANFVGDANLVPGDAGGDAASTPIGPVPLQARATGPVEVLLRPEELELADASGGQSGGEIELVEFYGHDTVYQVRLAAGPTVRVRAGSAPRFHRGDQVAVAYRGGAAVAYAAGGPGSASTPPREPAVPTDVRVGP